MKIQLLFDLNNIFEINNSMADLVTRIFYFCFDSNSLKLVTVLIAILVSVFLMFYEYQKTIEYNVITPNIYGTIEYINENIGAPHIQKMSDNQSHGNYNKYLMSSKKISAPDSEEELIFMIDSIGYVLYANKNALKFFQGSKGEVLGKSIFGIYDKLEVNDSNWFNEVIKEKESHNIVKCMCENNEKLVLINYHANVNTSGKVESIIATGNDVTSFVKSEVIKNFYQKQDYLTGIMNHYGMSQKLKQMKDCESAISFFIEIMHFTQIVNYYGHSIIDDLLNEIVIELKSIASENTLVARYNECKFVIVFFNNTINDEVISNYKDKVESFLYSSYKISKLNLQIDKRAGYAVYPLDTKNIEEIVSLSSIALKDTLSKNSTEIQRYQKNMMESLNYNLELANKLKVALDEEKIQVFFQKAIDCSNNRTYVIEELSRWYDDDLGYISPLDFFRIAKETNQLDRLDRYMVKKSLEGFKRLKDTVGTNNAKLTVNLSPNTLLNIKTFEYFNNVVKKIGLEPKEIYIEISEGTFVNKLDLCISRINLYKSHGYLIALDDFGIEYSSLAILEKVDFDIIKLDALFVRNISNISNQEIIKMIRRITDITDKEMIAEGVETKEQSEKLRELGCLIQQGFYLHKPEDLLN